MQMVVIFVKVFYLTKLMKQIKDGNFNHLDAFTEDLTESTSLRKCTSCFAVFGFSFFFRLCRKVPLDELDFEDDTVAIVDVGKTVRAANGKAFVNACKVVIICGRNIEEALQILCVDLIF